MTNDDDQTNGPRRGRGPRSVETVYMEERAAVMQALPRLSRRGFMKVSLGAMGAAAAAGVTINPHSFQPISCLALPSGNCDLFRGLGDELDTEFAAACNVQVVYRVVCRVE